MPTQKKYKTPKALEEKINDYFSNPHKNMYKRTVYTEDGKPIEVPTPTITDLVLFLGFVNRQSFYDYETKYPEYSDIIKKARTSIERVYETLLQSGKCTGAIFALKNFGWVDKIETEFKGNLDINIHKILSEGDNRIEKYTANRN